MFRWPRKPTTTTLTGAPTVRREKSYSAASGYVYHYFYAGHRPAVRDGEDGTEYVFDTSTDRRTAFLVSVFLSESAAAGWSSAHERELSAAERYAIAKMALFQAFDERRDPGQMKEEVHVRAADLEAIMETLGLD